MKRSSSRAFAGALLALVAGAACGGTAARTSSLAVPPPATRPANAADVRFLTRMIPHHAQAVLFAGWAASHDAGRAVGVLCERIVVGQRDEIVTMRDWLRDHGEDIPLAEYTRMRTPTAGADHDMLMPGMLTEEQLAELDAARGPQFDRLFLAYMIPHHEGALTMVDELFGSYGAAQGDIVFKLASDIYADQSIEIERMQQMLAAQPPGGRDP